MLTGAVRDLHQCYPGQFQTDVRTPCPDLWEHNPLLTPLSEDDREVAQIDCSYPLINRCRTTPHHCLNGFIEFLSDRLKLAIKPTAFKGDIHLAPQERAWFSQVHELTGEDTPFWIVAAGGKYDVTIKWWQTERYQEVIDYFRGKILFVQVGGYGHHHPKLQGVIDLRGQTTLRELVRLVYHAQGVLCSVTALMHLAAAVETRPGRSALRPCVVVAGGREPAHWEAYPGHQFIHSNGALACGGQGGCWKDRIARLHDGDRRDRPGRLCHNLVNGLPRCLDLITPAEVIRRVELYYKGGVLKYFSPSQRRAANRGITAMAKPAFDEQPLTLQNAGTALERFLPTIPAYPGRYQGRGIVICGGGARYFACAWVCIKMLRRLGCALPIQLWHLGANELDERMGALVAPLGVECVDALTVRKAFPARRISGGWPLKPYAVLHSPFREVLLLDADNVPVTNPAFLFGAPQFRASGAVFWPDYAQNKNDKGPAIWRSCGLRQPREPEFESGQILVDKMRCWPALCLSLWFNEHSDFYYRYVHGDKETFHLAFRKLRQDYYLVPTPIHPLAGTMCQHDFRGRRLFQHRNQDKWDPFLLNRRVEDFWFEQECRDYLVELRRAWNGCPNGKRSRPLGGRWPKVKPVRIAAVMMSCPERDEMRHQTLANLARTDWDGEPVLVQMDEDGGSDHRSRQERCARLALKRALETPCDYILFLEDDLDFNRHIRHNLLHWRPVRAGMVALAGLYNPRLREAAFDFPNRARIVLPEGVFGSQAFLLSKPTADYVVRHWHRVGGLQDIKISRLAGRLKQPILYHAPSLVQHIGSQSVWGGGFHQASDFDPDWRA